jgi:tRNA(Ile)-lysidine synthetase-like protein
MLDTTVMPPSGMPVVLAVSGGADSCALWDLVMRDGRWPVVLFHLDHGLRPDAPADAAWVAARARAYAHAGLPHRAVVITAARVADEPGNREANARRARYERLAGVAAAYGCAVVATAHHAGDQAETVLLHILRGAGPAGSAGMAPSRPLAPGIHVVRPLLTATPAALRTYLRGRGLDWREDPSNRDLRLRRNAIRHCILPAWEAALPGISAALAMATIRPAVAAPSSDRVPVPPIPSPELWRAILLGQGVAVTRRRLARLADLAAGPPGRQVRLGRILVVRRTRAVIWAARAPVPATLTITGPGRWFVPGGVLVCAAATAPDRHVAAVAHLAATLPFIWRPPEPGERFHPLGAPGRQRISRYRSEHGVHPWRRDDPVLADGRGALWLPGLTVAERARTSPGQAVLRIHLEYDAQAASLGPAMQHVTAVILAAGKGTRMGSDLAKVLHPLAGRPLIHHVLGTCAALGLGRTVVVVGHQRDAVQAAVTGFGATCVLQDRQLGTGHAVRCAESACQGDTVLVLCGDCPLTPPELLRAVLERQRTTGAACVAIAARMPDPTGYGRMVTGADGRLERIVEHKDATPDERRIDLINSGIYAFDRTHLFRLLAGIRPANAQGEYYLTDVIGLLRGEGRAVELVVTDDPAAVLGINTPGDLATATQMHAARG